MVRRKNRDKNEKYSGDGHYGRINHNEDRRQKCSHRSSGKNSNNRGRGSTNFSKFRDSNDRNRNNYEYSANNYEREPSNSKIPYYWQSNTKNNNEASTLGNNDTNIQPAEKIEPSKSQEPTHNIVQPPLEIIEPMIPFKKIKLEKIHSSPVREILSCEDEPSSVSKINMNTTEKVMASELESTPNRKKNAESTKVAAVVKTKPQSSSSSSSSSSDSSSDSSSSSEEEIPKMPFPILKNERSFENTPEKSSSVKNESKKCKKTEDLCWVCKKEGHFAVNCKAPCRRCTQTSYQSQISCNHCGEIYQNDNDLPKPPNPFAMFMQFMQFCIGQYKNYSPEFFPVMAPPPVQGSTHGVEVTRQDIVNDKMERKKPKTKRKSKGRSLKSDLNSDSDSDVSSKATTSKKKLIKRENTQNTQLQPQQPNVSCFTGPFPVPGSMGYPNAFNSPGYNPMMAFSQMMGYNQPPMNYPH